MAKNDKPYQKPTHDEIAALALRIYEKEGRPQGKAQEHWLKAEAQLLAERKAQAGPTPAQTPAKPAIVTASGTQGAGWQTNPRQPVLHRN